MERSSQGVCVYVLLFVVVVGCVQPIGAAENDAPRSPVIVLQRPMPLARGFEVREPFKIQCRNWETGEWGPGPVCKETGQEIQFFFGVDMFFYCGLHIDSSATYDHLASFIEQKRTWQCRVPMTPDSRFYLPLALPLWGITEPDHFHLDNHMNFAFHADKGRIIGATAYPLRDRFQLGRPDSLIHLHGPVRWFEKHSYASLGGLAADDSLRSFLPLILGWCLLSALLALLIAALVYLCYLKPHLRRKLLKRD
eukprot:TRINITY_DN11523_c0_g4_i1.p1 TRINITY_DN11523_c0_g4~~TRINITY_DN11523_c0_g4_i1.p1  ORF type:complete len:252 (-),score=40.51 TRINITY_DN11523_c0_g4_i1:32-787(-)